MRKVMVLEFMTLDGRAQTIPEDDGSNFKYEGWQSAFNDDLSSAAMKKQMSLPFDLLLGRVTFEGWEGYWPKHTDFWPGCATATKYVASNTRTSSDWQPIVFLSGDVPEKVRQLKQEDGSDLHVYGSANLVQTLMKHDLVDEFWLKIYPVTLGNGKKLFLEGTIPAAFKVTESLVTTKGVFFVNYARAGEVKTGSLG